MLHSTFSRKLIGDIVLYIPSFHLPHNLKGLSTINIMLLYCLLLALVPFVQAQTPDPGNPGAANTDTSCAIAGWPAPGQVYYYAPDDTLPLGEYVTTTGCKPSEY
jgi:hypothetical protein